MPELPEVEVVRRGLAAALTGRTIGRVELVGAHGLRAVRRHAAGPVDFVRACSGRTVTDVRRRGKYLWLVLDGCDALVAHLGMSGQFRIRGPVATTGSPGVGPSHDAYDAALHPHTRVRFHLFGASATVDFLDQRTFGGLFLVRDGADVPAPIAHIARDVLDPAFDRAAAQRAIRSRRSGIKRVLLDQSVVSGIGNIYADEALWAARVHYELPADRLPARRVGGLLDAVMGVMAAALDAGGTSFDELYVNVNGESGYFERSLNVYGREGERCPRCGARIVREPWTNRSSYRCPRCQREG